MTDETILSSEIRGSIKLVTHSRNASGPYRKAKLTQPPSSTPAQVERRNALAAAVIAWRNISDAQYLDWNNFCKIFFRHKSISRHVILSPYNEYISRYIYGSLISGVLLNITPYPRVRAYPVLSSITISFTSILLSWHSVTYSSPCTIIISASRPLSAGINSPNPYLIEFLTTVIATAFTQSTDIYSSYISKYILSSADIGKKVFLSIRAVNTDNFARSIITMMPFIVTADLISGACQTQIFFHGYGYSFFSANRKTSPTPPTHTNRQNGKLQLFKKY